jgi:hypothetical protein
MLLKAFHFLNSDHVHTLYSIACGMKSNVPRCVIFPAPVGWSNHNRCCFGTVLAPGHPQRAFISNYHLFPLPFIALNTVAGMLAVLCSAPRPPMGVALLGLLITALSSTLRLLPYVMFCCMIVLSIWVPSRPAELEPMYDPFPGPSNTHVYPVYTSTPPADKIRPFELSASQRILIFLLSVPVTSIFENVLFRPARDFVLRTVEFWFDLRYVQPAQATGSWPDTWTPILNALRSVQFVADFIDGAVGNDRGVSARNRRGVLLSF